MTLTHKIRKTRKKCLKIAFYYSDLSCLFDKLCIFKCSVVTEVVILYNTYYMILVFIPIYLFVFFEIVQ